MPPRMVASAGYRRPAGSWLSLFFRGVFREIGWSWTDSRSKYRHATLILQQITLDYLSYNLPEDDDHKIFRSIERFYRWRDASCGIAVDVKPQKKRDEAVRVQCRTKLFFFYLSVSVYVTWRLHNFFFSRTHEAFRSIKQFVWRFSNRKLPMK